MLKKMITAAIVSVAILLSGVTRAEEPAPPTEMAGADYVELLNSLYAVGCTVGTLAGFATAYVILHGFPAGFLSLGLAGCGAGMVAGPLGMFVHDHVNKDDTVYRYIRDRYPQLLEGGGQ